MKKNCKGIISIEATIVLVSCMFLILFILNFSYVFRAKNYMSYVIMQTGQGIAFQTYKYEMEEDAAVLELVRNILSLLNYDSDNSLVRSAIKSKDYKTAARQYMLGCVTTEDELKSYGINPNNIEFTTAQEDENDIRLIVKYKVDFPFEVFYISNVVLEQQKLAGMWKLE